MMRKVAAAVLVCLLLPCCALAQSPDATITGRVTDPSKAAIPGAKVIVTNVDTGVQRSVATDSDGLYTIVFLKPGNYKIEVEKQGFRTVVKPDVVLHVQDAPTINFEMAVGTLSESVTVSGGAPLVNTESAAVSTVVDRNFAENLPMNGRSFQTLIEMTPGVVVTPSTAGDSGQFSVNGQRGVSNYWSVDGVSANIGVSSSNTFGNGVGGTLASFSVLGGTNSLVSVDAMQEFRVQTSTYAPEFGRTPGGQISIVTRSGTNQWHGTLFDYLRNDIFDANDWFNGLTNPPLPKAKDRQNDFGGTFGGPILKDKTFFFFSYEGLRLRLPQTALTTVPDASFTPGGTTNSRQNATPSMQPFLNAFPLPNPSSPEIYMSCTPNVNGCPASGQRATGSAQFNASFSDSATLDAYSLRLDHRIGGKLALFGRYNYSPSELTLRGAGLSLSTVFPSRITTQTGTIGTTWIISSRATNDLRFNYSRTDAKSSSYLDNFGGAVPLASLPFPNPFTSNDAVFALSVFALTGSSLNSGEIAHNIQKQINVVDSLSFQKDSHNLKFGVDFRRLSPVVSPPAYTLAVFFLRMSSAEAGQPLFGVTQSANRVHLVFHNLGIFAQDTWRILPRLTLTYGLRWDVDFAPSSVRRPDIPAITGYDLSDFSRLAIAAAGTPPFKTTYDNIAPRLGLAYQLAPSHNWSSVVRGGFGVFYDLVSSEAGNLLSAFPPPFGAFGFPSGTFPYSPTPPAPSIPPTGSISQLYAFNANLKVPYTLEWNVAFEQALGKQQSLSLSYIGASGRRLLQTFAISAPPTNPNLSGDFIDNTASSRYDALQIQFQRRLSQGLQVLGSYGWSHSIDDGSASSTQSVSNRGVSGVNPGANRGPSDFDIRHSFTAGLTYNIPVPRVSAFMNALLGGWSTENFIFARTAPPVDVSDTNFFEFNGGIQADIRPDLVPGQSLYLFGSKYPGGKAFNPAAFTHPPADPTTGLPLRQGNVPRNFLRGFGATQWDLAVHRDFPIRESVKLQFRAEMFNVLNHPNFAPPSGAFGSGGFGVSKSLLGQYLAGTNLGGGAFSPLYQIGGPRSIQLALKLFF